MPVTVRPTGADIAIANAITRNTKPAPEAIARALTWGADEKVLLALAAAGWLASRGRSDVLRRAGNHALFVTIAASLLPHGLKAVFDQTRPDRRTVVGHLHGVRFPASVTTPFRLATRCIWARSLRPPAHCPRYPAGRSRRLPSVFPLRAYWY